jgi:hypothetical protein
MAKRRVRYPIAPISVSVFVKIAGYYSLLGLHDPTVHPPYEPRACPLYQLDLRRGHLRSEPALPVVVVKGAAAFVARRLLLVSRCCVAACRQCTTMHHRLEEHLLKRGMPQRALLGTTRSASLSLESKKVPVALQSAVLCRGVEATTHSRARASPNPPSPYCMQCTS